MFLMHFLMRHPHPDNSHPISARRLERRHIYIKDTTFSSDSKEYLKVKIPTC